MHFRLLSFSLTLFCVAHSLDLPDILDILPLVRRDPDANRNISQIISHRGYPVEEYSVPTRDGYILGVQRIPYGLSGERNAADRPAVLMQHGLLESATDWVVNFPHQSLGYILADQGYDVWLGNHRGNTYSRKHVEYSPEDPRFWNFTIDDYAEYDVPDTVDFILKTTGRQHLYYVGQSQGNTVVYALLSQRPDYNKIKAVFSLGPVATVGYITSPLRHLAGLSDPIDRLYQRVGYKEVLGSDFLTDLVAQVGCGFRKLNILCSNLYFLMNGYNPSQLNKTRLNVYLSHYPAGTSTKNVVHLGQMVSSKKLQKFDYGEKKNFEAYNQSAPPEYALENIRTPIALFWSSNDTLADPKDVGLLRDRVRNLLAFYRVKAPMWGHLDFILGIDANKYVYQELLKVMRSA